MNGAKPLHSIGDLSAITGVPVRTIRFYSDTGLLPPTDRTRAGYRRYGDAAPGRLRLICVLRDLDVGLNTIRRVLDGDLSVAEVAAAHADATTLRIRALRMRQSLLRLVARRGSGPEETVLMHRLTRLTSAERETLVSDFVAGLSAEGSEVRGAAAVLRTALPVLPDDPSDARLDAWVELAELMADDGFRAQMARAPFPPADEEALPGVAPGRRPRSCPSSGRRSQPRGRPGPPRTVPVPGPSSTPWRNASPPRSATRTVPSCGGGWPRCSRRGTTRSSSGTGGSSGPSTTGGSSTATCRSSRG